MRKFSMVFLAVTGFWAIPSLLQAELTSQIVHPPGWTESSAWDINENGDVVGGGVDGSGIRKGFIYSTKTNTYIEILPQGWSGAFYVYGINNNRDVIGREYPTSRGFLYHGSTGTYTELPFTPSAINNHGDVVGMAGSGEAAFLYSGGTCTEIRPPGWTGSGASPLFASGINDNGCISGGGTDNGVHKGFVYCHGTYTTLYPTNPPPACTYVGGGKINNNCQAIVTTWPVGTGSTDFIYNYNGGTYTPLLPPGWDHAGISDINDYGDAVGYAFVREKSYLYQGGVYTQLSVPSLTEIRAYGINNHGYVAGEGFNGSGQPRGFLIAPHFDELSIPCGKTATLDLVKIPAGSFMMGTNDTSVPLAQPWHQVTISHSFYMGKYEITQAQYQAVMGTNPSDNRDPSKPVEEVSWDNATAFCQQLAQAAGLTVRLPTEAEWEYACKADKGNIDTKY